MKQCSSNSPIFVNREDDMEKFTHGRVFFDLESDRLKVYSYFKTEVHHEVYFQMRALTYI